MQTFEELRAKYSRFIYRDVKVEESEDRLKITYDFSIPGLCDFEPTWEFPKCREVDLQVVRELAFQLGMVECISYWKCACPPVVEVACGALSAQQIAWWRKLYYYGLGEFMYRNAIDVSEEELVRIACGNNDPVRIRDGRAYSGCLVPIGGGKDSVVTLEVMKGEEITTYSINGNETTRNVIAVCRDKAGDYRVRRTLDKRLLERNAEGFLNGHTPFSAIVAFSSVISAYLTGRRYICLSNETSANESTVKDSFVNHQYSKSFEFEQDFRTYIAGVIDTQITYFSLLRPLAEIQIAQLFAQAKAYHKVFRSCNVGSKKGIWCCNCPKCLFVYIILLPFLSEAELIEIFGENLLNKESLDKDFKELCGISENKPFECVGTRAEVQASLKNFVEQGGSSLLTDRYRDYILAQPVSLERLLRTWTDENNVPEEYAKRIRRKLGL